MEGIQSFLVAFLNSAFSTPAFEGGIRFDNSIDLFAKANDASANVDKAKLSGAGESNSSAIRRKLHGHALPNTSAADLIVID